MAVLIKTSNLAFLTKMNLPPNLIQELMAEKISLTLGIKEFSFVLPDGSLAVKKMLPASANDLVKGATSSYEYNTAKNLLISGAEHALLKAQNKKVAATLKFGPGPGHLQPNPQHPSVTPAGPLMNADGTYAIEPETPTASTLGTIPLRDATIMYQRVRGTSTSSVYVLVAVGEGVKVAARSPKTSSGLSIRVEGNLTTAIKTKLVEHGLSVGQSKSGGEYMSGHYTCNANVNAARVLGSVLMGTGIAFVTPFPLMEKVKELSE